MAAEDGVRIAIFPRGISVRLDYITDPSIARFMGGRTGGERLEFGRRLLLQANTQGHSLIAAYLSSSTVNIDAKLYALYKYFGEAIMASVANYKLAQLNPEPFLPLDQDAARLATKEFTLDDIHASNGYSYIRNKVTRALQVVFSPNNCMPATFNDVQVPVMYLPPVGGIPMLGAPALNVGNTAPMTMGTQ